MKSNLMTAASRGVPFGTTLTFQVGDHSVRMSLMEIDPDTSAAWLEKEHPSNRKTPSTAAKYAMEMAAGGWRWTPEPIVFSVDGFLVNGANRLRAVVKSGVTIPATVWFDCPADVFAALDRGKVRSIAQADMMAGIASTPTIYQLARTMFTVESRRIAPSDTELRRLARALSAAWEACSALLAQIKIAGRTGLRMGAALVVCLAWMSDPSIAIAFLSELQQASERTITPGNTVRNFLRWYEHTMGQAGQQATAATAWATASALRQLARKEEKEFVRATEEAWLFWRARPEVAAAIEAATKAE